MSSHEADKVHLWIGSNYDSEEQYHSYFALDYSTDGDFDDPAYQVCPFCRYLGIKWYDEDFIGIIPREAEDVALDEILQEAAIDKDEISKVKAICSASGIEKTNAILWYSSGDLPLSPAVAATSKV
ncbi:immunity 22 family protein [Kosakonia cowanii]